MVTENSIREWMDRLHRVYSENRAWLTELDSAIGDADHGINMDRGFTAVKAAVDSGASPEVSAILQTVATTLIRTVGGASGPLYGTFFLRASTSCAGKSQLAAEDVVALFRAGVEGVRQRGKAGAGDKTMLDALLPALAAMEAALAKSGTVAEVLAAGASAAEGGMLATAPMQARKGRASFLGPRSVGHQDPGATSAWLMIREAAAAWRQEAA
jgi:phosphoenolpyruvate---glycerone phosphotransferase subunit DhaL